MFEAVGMLAVIFGAIILLIGMGETTAKISLFGFLMSVLGLILIAHPLWKTWYLFLKNAAMAVPTLVWVVAGITAYFTFNHVYASWRMYVYAHPESFAKKILNPWPTILMPPTRTPERVGHYMFGTILFILTWLIAFLCYTAWLIFGGGIAKLLHLMPRE